MVNENGVPMFLCLFVYIVFVGCKPLFFLVYFFACLLIRDFGFSYLLIGLLYYCRMGCLFGCIQFFILLWSHCCNACHILVRWVGCLEYSLFYVVPIVVMHAIFLSVKWVGCLEYRLFFRGLHCCNACHVFE
jgi:hypothetical protein